MREFKNESTLINGNLALSIAPALTPNGIENDPLFFNGEIINPTIVSGGLLVLADIVSTRYFKYVPVDQRDPILSAQGDRLRAECFSACNGVYARMDVFQSALDGDILYGTTNVDIGNNLRKSLLNIRQGDRLKFRIGDEGLKTLHSKNLDNGSLLTDIVTQRPVKMPDRWIRALGNCAMLHQNMKYKFHVEGMQAKSFIAMLPAATGKERSGWLTPTKTGVMLKSREEKNSVYISGIHRLSALKKIMSNVNSIFFYAPENGEPGQMMIEICMTGANITLSLTAKSYEGYSGEGALLDSLSTPKILECADKIDNLLNFESRLDIDKISKSIGIVKNDMNDAMELLAVSGKLGFDIREGAFFHRELPDDPDRVLKDNPRLVGAKKLVEDTEYIEDNIWHVRSGETIYRVIYPTDENLENAKCTCTWYLKHQNSRGPCKHILAVKLKKEYSMASKLEKAAEIYRSLGYEETDFDDILNLGIGNKKEQKEAREGLKSGDWTEIKQLSDNTYGFVSVVDVDLEKLAIFAIRVGVDAKRAANILRRSSEVALKAIKERGETFAMNCIKAACASSRRIWEHSLSVLGMLALKLVHEMNLEIPESVEYMKDWAAVAAILLTSKRKDYNFDEKFVIEKSEILRRFNEHIEAGVALNVPATGPFSKILIWGVQNNLITKDTAMEQVFYGLSIAQRPGDRKEYVNVLEQIGITDEEIKSRVETIIPLLGLGETALMERFAPVLIESATEDWLYTILISCSSAKVKKIKKLILNTVLKREKPKSVKEYEEWLLLYKQDEDKSIAKLAGSIEKAWGLEIEDEDIKEELQGLWRETPKLWEVPRFEIGEISPENLTDLLAEISDRKEYIDDVAFERFIAMANNIAHKNPDEAKISLSGITINDSSGIWALGRWAKNIENNVCPDSKTNEWNGEKEVLKIRYSGLVYTRRVVLFESIDKWPCILSTPSYEDLSISLPDLTDRLIRYKNENFLYVAEPDLQFAITRLDIERITKEDKKKFLEKTDGLKLKILLPLGDFLKDEKGEDIFAEEIIKDYLDDPYVEPEFSLGKSAYWREDVDVPKSLKAFPFRLSWCYEDMYSIFPTWGDYSLTAIRRDTEVYHSQGINLRQIAKRRKPLTKGAMMNWIAAWSNLSDENAADVITATNEAWERGLLLPGVADISYLDWSGGTPSNLASLAFAMENMAKDGMLSLVWMAACDVVEVSLKAPRMLTGTAEIVKFLRDYLDEVIFAVENKLAPQNALEMKAVKNLATKSGSSKAVEYAKEIVNKLNSLGMDIKEEKYDNVQNQNTPNDFDEVWMALTKAKKLIYDNVEFNINVFEVRKTEKAFSFDLKLPDIPDRLFQVYIYGWFYGIQKEAQMSGAVADSDGKIIDEKAKSVWLHYDPEKKKVVISKYRNWRGEKEGPLEGSSTPYSKIFLTIAVSTLAQDGESIYGAKSLFRQLADSGDLSVENLREVMRELLLHEEISPAKLVRIVEKENKLLSICYVMLIECIKYAGKMAAENKKPPVWVNRVLDICIYYADYLREAVNRGYISGEDAKWQGLLEIANSTSKSAAVNKAKSLAKILELG